MDSLQASQSQLDRIVKARTMRGWPIDSENWLLEASEILAPKTVSHSTWKRFLAGKPIRSESFTAFCQVLELDWQEIADRPTKSLKVSNNQDWGEIPDTSTFIDRASELECLRQWIEPDHVASDPMHRARTITILGSGGIGKTALAAKIAQELPAKFDYLMWRSLREAPPLQKILTDWIKQISAHQTIDLPASLSEQIALLINLLRSSRCLLILDNAESIFQSGALCGNYLPGYEAYGELFHRLSTTQHESCLLITSREQIPELRRLASNTAPIKTLQLGSMGAAAQQILTDKGIIGSQSEIDWLIDRYQGNPFILQIVAVTIQNTFCGSISDFRQSAAIHGDIQELLTDQCNRLSTTERSVIYWLAIYREPITVSALTADSLHDSPSTIVAALDSLVARSLIQTTAQGFTLQNVMMEYVTDRLIDEMTSELLADRFELFRTHAILQATAKDYIRINQHRLLLTPIADRLHKRTRLAILARKLRSTIAYFRREEKRIDKKTSTGYAIGNIINLVIGLGIDLTNYDFSELTIRQAYLAETELPGVNFTNSHFDKTVFSQSFGSIFSVAFSPDNQLLATGGMDGYVRLYQVSDGQQIDAWQAHSDWIRHVTFSPDGRMIASSSNDTTIKIWDWQRATCLRVLRKHTDWVWSSKFITWQGLVFLVSVSADRTGRIWNINTGICLFVAHEPEEEIWSVAFSNDGHTLASSSKGSIKLWNIWTKKFVKEISDNAEYIHALAFSPDGKTLIGSDYTELKVWNAETTECLTTLPVAENSAISTLMFSPDGGQLVTAGTDKLQIWDTQVWETQITISEPQHRIRSIAYSPDRTMIAVGSDDQLVRIFDARTSASLKTLRGVCNRIWAIAVSPPLTPDLIYLTSGSDDYKIRIWNAQTGELLRTQSGHQGRVRHLAFSPSGKLLASASHDRTIKLWDVATGECLQTWHGHTNWVWAVAFCQNERTLISAADDRTILRWDTETGEFHLLSDLDKEWIWSITTHPSLPLVAIAGNSPNIELWHLHDRTLDFSLPADQQRIRSIVFNATGDKLACSSDDQQIKLWHVDSLAGSLKHQLQYSCTLVGHTKEIRALTFIPPSNIHPELLVSASDDLTLRVWNPETGNCLGILSGHDLPIWSICYSPDLGLLYSCSEDETIKFWDLTTLTCLQTLTLPKPYRGMNISNASGLSDATTATLMALGGNSLETRKC